MNELKPCAHCGSMPMLFEDTEIPSDNPCRSGNTAAPIDNPFRWYVACLVCGMRTPKVGIKQAIGIWNRRASKDE